MKKVVSVGLGYIWDCVMRHYTIVLLLILLMNLCFICGWKPKAKLPYLCSLVSLLISFSCFSKFVCNIVNSLNKVEKFYGRNFEKGCSTMARSPTGKTCYLVSCNHGSSCKLKLCQICSPNTSVSINYDSWIITLSPQPTEHTFYFCKC